MNLAFHIYNFLREENARVGISGFGVFLLEKKHATLDVNTSKILPPREVITFEKEVGENDGALAEYIAKKTGVSVADAQQQINKEVEQWNQELFLNKKLDLDKLGTIELLGQLDMVFTQKEMDASMDYFGLEEIDLKGIQESPEKDYQLQKSILWGFLVGVPLLVLLFLGIQHRELIFGKSSFENTKRIKENPKPMVEPKKDSLIIPKDTLIQNPK